MKKISFLLFILTGLATNILAQNCDDIQRAYIIGDYKKCSISFQSMKNVPVECKYLSSLCNIAVYDYDTARYSLSVLSIPDKQTDKLSEMNALALNSLAEIAYLNGDSQKARTLSSEINSVLSKKRPASYEYAVSEILLARSYFDAKDSFSAQKRISMLKLQLDPLMYCSIEP